MATTPSTDPVLSSTTNLVVVEQGDPHVDLAPLIEKAKDFARASKAASTWKTYESVWRVFSGWCTAQGVPALPTEI